MIPVVYDPVLAEDIAAKLLAIEAVKIQPDKPFTWSSGIISPIYCDNRLTLSDYDLRMFIGSSFGCLVRDKAPETKRIAGIATGGIAHGDNAANNLKLPFLYVREKSKAHGRQNQIEGVLRENDPVFVIEDLISTGGSSKRAVEALHAEGAIITGVAAIVTYGLNEADENFAAATYPVYALTDYDTILRVAAAKGLIASEQIEFLQTWKKDPRGWMPN